MKFFVQLIGLCKKIQEKQDYLQLIIYNDKNLLIPTLFDT